MSYLGETRTEGTMDGLELREIGEDNTLLLVDDDEPFVKRLARAMEKRGFEPLIAQSVAQGRAIVATKTPAYAVGNGLPFKTGRCQ